MSQSLHFFNLYCELQKLVHQEAYSTCVVFSHKLLSDMSVERGAEAGRDFGYYLEWLSSSGYVTPAMAKWIGELLAKSDTAPSSGQSATCDDAEALVSFVGIVFWTMHGREIM